MRASLQALRSASKRCRSLENTRLLFLKNLSTCDESGLFNGRAGQSQYDASSNLWPYAFGLAAASAWLEVKCEANPDYQNTITDTRIKVMRAWSDVQHDFDRIQASMPFATQIKRSLISQLMVLLGDQGSSLSVKEGKVELQVTSCGAAQVYELKNTTGGRISARLFVPQQGGSSGEIELLIEAGESLTEQEVTLITAVFQAASGIQRSPRGDSYSFSQSYRGGDFDELVGQLTARALAGLDGIDYNSHFQDMMNRLEYAFFPEMNVEQQMKDMMERYSSPHIGQEPEALKDAQTSNEDQIDYGSSEANEAVKQLQQLGAIVYPPGLKGEVDWGLLAGYEEQKEMIEETLLLAMIRPEVYTSVASKTRKNGGSNRPRAVLFEGPPGCGKTTSARVLATQASAPLVYVPIEAIASKWYGEHVKPMTITDPGASHQSLKNMTILMTGESEKILSQIFEAAEKLETCLVFLDEIDSLATSRGSEMHEATRRILGVLLRQLDGFEGKRSIVIGATNRKQDLDAALRSRFDASIHFQLPNAPCRQQILSHYAQQLEEGELEQLAGVCEGMSGRDLRDVCEQAERKTASQIIRGRLPENSIPALADYLQAAAVRQKTWNGAKSLPDLLAKLREKRM